MKYKVEDTEHNPFLKSICDIITVNLRFKYAIKSGKDFMPEKECEFHRYFSHLQDDLEHLTKLYISLNPEHIRPTIDVELEPVKSVKELMDLEEKYYNILKETGNNGLEANNIEVVAYLSNILVDFKHYFCTLNEGNIQRETSS